jgi:hypothetical protein
VRVALLPPSEDGQDILPADESRRSRSHQERHAGGSSTGRSGLSRRRISAECSIPGTVPNRRHQVQNGRRDRRDGRRRAWELKDLRKTGATYYDEHMPESSTEILGHSVGGITYVILPIADKQATRPIAATSACAWFFSAVYFAPRPAPWRTTVVVQNSYVEPVL